MIRFWNSVYSKRQILEQTNDKKNLKSLPPDHAWASECPDVKNYKWRLNLVWHRMLYSCTHMATVGVKGLKIIDVTESKGGYMSSCLGSWSSGWQSSRGLNAPLGLPSSPHPTPSNRSVILLLKIACVWIKLSVAWLFVSLVKMRT